MRETYEGDLVAGLEPSAHDACSSWTTGMFGADQIRNDDASAPNVTMLEPDESAGKSSRRRGLWDVAAFAKCR
jgi:hypothetical protein